MRRLALFSLAVLALLTVAHLIRRVAPLDSRFPGNDRLEFFVDNADDYDVVFVGNSRVYRGIVPAEFDARMAEHGFATRSFNLGAPGMRAFEAELAVRYLARLRGDRLKVMVLGPGLFDPRIRSWERGTRRSVAWHTVGQTLAVLKATWRRPRPLSERLGLARQHLTYFLRRQSNHGEGPPILRAWFGKASLSVEESDQLRWEGGFQGLEGLDNPTMLSRRRRFLANEEEFRAEVARNARRQGGWAAQTTTSLAGLARLGLWVRATGPQAVLLIGPAQGRLARFGGEIGVDPPLLNFDDPNRYPELFDPELRFDSSHLNREGATLYTRLLADSLAGLLEARAETRDAL